MQTKNIKIRTRPDTAFAVAVTVKQKPIKAVQPSIPRPTPSEIAAMEFGFIQAERGHNLQFALAEFARLFQI